MTNELIGYSNVFFDAKPDAIPYNYRISYKVGQLCLVFRICGRGGSCSLIKLHLISYALISNDNLNKLIGFVKEKTSTPIVRFDPAVNRALTYAIAYGLLEQLQTSKFKLTDRGCKFADLIMNSEDLFRKEIDDLNTISKNLTENKINEIVDRWKRINVDN